MKPNQTLSAQLKLFVPLRFSASDLNWGLISIRHGRNVKFNFGPVVSIGQPLRDQDVEKIHQSSKDDAKTRQLRPMFHRAGLRLQVFGERESKKMEVLPMDSLGMNAIPDLVGYIGPGAGVSVLGALFGLFSMILLAVTALLKSFAGSLFGFTNKPKSATSVTPRENAAVVSTSATRTNHPSKILTIAFIIAAAGWFEWPQQIFNNGVNALAFSIQALGDVPKIHHSTSARFPASSQGVVKYDASKAFDGYNVELTATANEVRLLDMNGSHLHTWKCDRNAIAVGWLAKGLPQNDLSALYWRRVLPLPDGSILVLFENSRVTPYAMGMLKLDWNSKITWMAPEHYHHSMDVDTEGNIYTLYQEVANEPPTFASRIRAPFLDEGVAILDPNGNEVERIGILNAFRETEFENYLNELTEVPKADDPLHMNCVQVISDSIADKLPFANRGDLFVSIRNIDTVALINRQTRKVSWAARGVWRMQHEPFFTEDGTMLVFDNQGAANGCSRALEWHPTRNKTLWSFTGSYDLPLKSSKYANLSRLPNGNRLVNSTYSGRSMEVTPENEVVWEWRSDRRLGDQNENIGHLMEIVRVPLDFFDTTLLIDKENSNVQ